MVMDLLISTIFTVTLKEEDKAVYVDIRVP